ncbi:hypothetical protein B0H63DRAFT_392246, partial [Podospora didyma]
LEKPDKSWQRWEAITSTRKLAKIRHRLVFDVLGRKTADELVFANGGGDVSDFLESLYSLSSTNRNSLFNGDTIQAEKYKWLFWFKGSIVLHLDDMKNARRPDKDQINTLSTLVLFINHTFNDAERMQGEMRRSGQASYEHLWTLFRPQEIMYEKRLVPPNGATYEQCLRIKDVQDVTTVTDQRNALRLVIEEVVYKCGSRPGPRLAVSRRYIQEFTGTRAITVEGLGIAPLSMLPWEEQEAIRVRLIDRGRRYIELCSKPFSVMDYDGPLRIFHLSTDESLPLYETLNEDLYSICRGHVPAYLLSSVMNAIGVMVSGLRPTTWGRLGGEHLNNQVAAAVKPRIDLGLWKALIGDFLASDGSRSDLEAFQRHRVSGAGLVLLLQGRRKVTHEIARGKC